jgi:hypothetical protein
VIDLSRDENVPIPPQQYHKVKHIEDRLFISNDYVPLFTTRARGMILENAVDDQD